jgi:hypothetical protein
MIILILYLVLSTCISLGIMTSQAILNTPEQTFEALDVQTKLIILLICILGGWAIFPYYIGACITKYISV